MAATLYDNATYLFPDSGDSARLTLFRVFQTFQVIAHGSVQIEFYIAMFGVLLTSFHILILSRKAMMTSSVITIMTVVAVFDIVSMLITIKSKSMMYGTEGSECTPPATSFAFRFFWLTIAIRDMVRRSSTWLGVLMALIRYSGLRFAMNELFRRASKPIFGVYAMTASLIPSLILSVFYWLRFEFVETGKWSPSTKCTDYSPSVIEPIFEQKPSNLFTVHDGLIGKSFMLINGLASKIIPCFLLPLLTALLIFELQKAKKARLELNSQDKDKTTDRTTALVIFMAISFFLAEVPIGTALALQVAYTDIGFLFLATYVAHFCNLLFTLNSITHCLVFFAMSSQYRLTIERILRIVTKSEATSKVSQVKSSRHL